MADARAARPVPPGDELSARERIRDAMVDLVLANGVEVTTVEMVIERAGVSRTEFDRRFEGKEDLYLSIFEEFSSAFEVEAFAAYAAHDNWRDGLRAAAYAAARYVRDHPRETTFGAIQMFAAGDIAQVHREAQLQRMVELVDLGRQELEDPDSMTRATAEGVVGSIYEMLLRELRGGRGTGSAEDFVPDLMFVAVRPYLGQKAALEELSIPPPPEAAEGGGNGSHHF